MTDDSPCCDTSWNDSSCVGVSWDDITSCDVDGDIVVLEEEDDDIWSGVNDDEGERTGSRVVCWVSIDVGTKTSLHIGESGNIISSSNWFKNLNGTIKKS